MRTPNYFHGTYPIGRTHSGILAYVCGLHNDGRRQPLRDVLDGLGLPDVKPPEHVDIRFEFEGADLGLLDDEHCFLLVEMKVDDREGHKKATARDAGGGLVQGEHYRQTELYGHRAVWHNRQAASSYKGMYKASAPPVVLLVTLGVGAVGHLPAGEHIARHITLEVWRGAFAKIRDVDDILDQYVAALDDQRTQVSKAVSEEFWRKQGEGTTNLRAIRHAPMYRLGELVEVLPRPTDWPEDIPYAPYVKAEGAGGDVMLQFNYLHPGHVPQRPPLYLELTSNGRLSFKLAAWQLPDGEKQAAYERIQNLLREHDGGDGPLSFSNAEAYLRAKHRTVATWEVGLRPKAKLRDEATLETVAVALQRAFGVYAEVMAVA